MIPTRGVFVNMFRLLYAVACLQTLLLAWWWGMNATTLPGRMSVLSLLLLAAAFLWAAADGEARLSWVAVATTVGAVALMVWRGA
jgi:hypothetical protein